MESIVNIEEKVKFEFFCQGSHINSIKFSMRILITIFESFDGSYFI